jgi:indolepyruvate ferredoxin oxidoreductase
MNAHQDLRDVTLFDKFEQEDGNIFISGTQALARLALLQRQLDKQQGLNTRGFISGYRGSPLGGLDTTLWQEKQRMEDAGVVFQPGINEDLAATAVWGTQQVDFFPEPQVDGVYAMWYGKAPGVDRSADAMRHGNSFGSHKNGGVLVVAGDDHPGKSSTVVNQSEPLLRALDIPVLYPSNVQEIIEFGLLGWELSRYCGLWVGLKTTNETVEQTQTVTLNVKDFSVQRPDRGLDATNVNIQRTAFNPQGMDITVKRVRLPLVPKFIRANGIDKIRLEGTGGLGIVTSGKSYSDVMQAFSLLGLNADSAKALGVAVYKVGCVWPLEPEGLKEFSQGRPELLFIEEKTAMVEPQAAQLLINQAERIQLVGKQDEFGNTLLPSDVQLEPSMIADVIMARLENLNTDKADAAFKAHFSAHFSALKARHDSLRQSLTANTQYSDAAPSNNLRTPYFCSGCPHNTSTKVPEGSMAMAGIGCHGIVMMTRNDTLLSTQMGGEGMTWAGAAHFSGTEHMFQNLGDGTYFHSGLLAIRGAVSSGVNITYKILYNDAVAMTGGQPIDGPITVHDMVLQLTAESVKQVVVVSDDPEKFRGKLPSGITIHPREELELVQKQLRQMSGTTVLIYEQTCATEKRRRRKRGNFPNPAKRMFINDAVCEGCGDCSVQSTCVSIQPKPTTFGIKRQIDQSSCNKDYSCVNGFCPSFVTVLDAEPKKPSGATFSASLFDELPSPAISRHLATPEGSMAVMIAGIGGTGVITVGAIIGMAAHLEGKACSIYDMTGLSQKNGAVYSHLRIANDPEDLAAQRIGAGEADLVLGFDLVAALAGDAALTFGRGRTRLVGNSAVQPTAAFQFDRDFQISGDQVETLVTARTGEDMAWFADATNLALKLMGDTIASNMFMVGYAAQLGLLPISIAALEKAINLNGIVIDFNLNALSLGRLFAHTPEKVLALLPQSNDAKVEQTLDELIEHRETHLTNYQNKAWANQYRAAVDKTRKAEQTLNPSSEALSHAVAHNLAKLMSYKDEYEVGRLFSVPEFKQQLDAQFEPGYKLKFNMAPPLISRKHPSTGLPMKQEFGSWMLSGFQVLAKLKGLRGTALDIFGYSAERRRERTLITEYETMLEKRLANLSSDNLSDTIRLARLPEDIRGYGHVKQKSLDAAGMGTTETIPTVAVN